MMLTLTKEGEFAVYDSSSMVVLEVSSLEELYEEMQKYDVDFVSPTLLQKGGKLKDKLTQQILNEFRLQRLKIMIAVSIYGDTIEA